MKISHAKFKNVFHLVVVAMICSFLVGGCQPLRKKFIRQKKDDGRNSQTEVIFEPQDYSPEKFTAEEKYTKNYNLWVIWGKSLEETIEEGSSNEKRYKYFLNKGLEALREMRLYLKDNKKAELDEMIATFEKMYQEFNKPYALWNKVRIRNQASNNSIKIRTSFNPKDLQGNFVDQ